MDRRRSTSAAWKGNQEVVAWLLGENADGNLHNRNEHWGTTLLHAAAHANQAAIVERLIERVGADLNAHDLERQDPLNDSLSFHKATAAAKVLRKHGAT